MFRVFVSIHLFLHLIAARSTGQVDLEKVDRKAGFFWKPQSKRAVAEDATAPPEDDVGFFWKPKFGKRSVEIPKPNDDKKRAGFFWKPQFKRSVAEEATAAPEDH